MPPHPGIVPLRPLDAGEIVGGALRFLRRDPSAVVPCLLYAVAVLGTVALRQLTAGPPASNPFDVVGTFLRSSLAALPPAVVVALVGPPCRRRSSQR